MAADQTFKEYMKMEQKAAWYAAGILASAFMVFGGKTYAAGAQLQTPYVGETAYVQNGRREIDEARYYFYPGTGQMVKGWQVIDGNHYYFYPETGQMVKGWQVIDGNRYYFYPETGQMVKGWQVIDGNRYYFYPETGQMTTGWQEVDGESYYFSPETGQMATGWQEIDWERYYFVPETGQMVIGWQEIYGEVFYFVPETGLMATGCWEIEDESYYFSPESGEMLTGWQDTEMGQHYFSKESGRMATGWQKIGGNKYYFSLEEGVLVTGLAMIDGEYYLFHEAGQLAKSNKTSLVTAGRQIYCADKNGKPTSGWQVIGNKLYYATKSGKVKKNTTYHGITFGSNGAAKNNLNAKLKIKAMELVASITKKNMTKSQKLAKCWDYVIGDSFRYAAKYPDLEASGWQRKAAYDMLTSRSGNCYSFACVFAALAEEVGYQPYVVCGRVRGSRDRMSDGYTRHAWVRIDGKYYDPEAHYAGWRRGIYGNSVYPVSHSIQKIVAY